VAGALAGGIVAVELWKARHRVRGSTGGSFVLPMATGIMIGRLGCLFAGLPDLTYGTPTALRWAVDLGDGVGGIRCSSMKARPWHCSSPCTWWRGGAGRIGRGTTPSTPLPSGGAQRFVWEFFKPYPNLAGPFNLFHLICGGLVVYGIVYWRNDRRRGAQGGALCVPQPDDEHLRNLP
jgi:prolipoprotein diacylglyceryltransferase